MAGQQALLLVRFLLPGLLLSEAAKILTLSLPISLRISTLIITKMKLCTVPRWKPFSTDESGFTEEEKSYKVINWFLPEDDNKEFKKSFHFFMEETFEGSVLLPLLFATGHPHVHLFVTHGGINSVMEAIQHGLLMLKQIKAETLALNMKQVIEDKRLTPPSVSANKQKSAMVDTSIMKRSHPLTPSQRLTAGAAHLKPHTFQQPWWHEQYLLDLFSFLLAVTLGTTWLCGQLLGLVA
ncbi:hypothetical protein EI555_002004, partial [Monodon monoceros]